MSERPFSLTSDPRYFFKSSSHGRVLESLTFALRRREPFLLVTGDLGVGKTILCRALVEQARRRGPVSFVSNPLVTPGGLIRLLLEDFRAASADLSSPRLIPTSSFDLHALLTTFLDAVQTASTTAIVVIDEAHRLPPPVVEELIALAVAHPQRDRALQLVLVGQAPASQTASLGIPELDGRIVTTARVLPLGREELSGYVAHRLGVAGPDCTATFAERAVDVLYGLSNGVPRLVNLLAERALQEAAAQGSHTIEPAMITAAASSLELAVGRPRRFRWFSKRIS